MNSSSKGHTFEWGIAKTLSLWWSENKNDKSETKRELEVK